MSQQIVPMKKLLLILLLPFLSSAQDVLKEDIVLMNKDIELPGTLTAPNLTDNLPLVIFVHGSGPVDRNGNQGALTNTAYIQQLADSLCTKGIAFYSYDKRTANPKNLNKLQPIVFQDFVADVETAITHFSKDKRFSSIHLLGHSQGSLVAMLATNELVHSFTSLAGPASTIDKTLIAQISAQNQDLGKATEQHLQELMATDTILTVNPFLLQLFAPQNQKFIKSWVEHNPSKEIQKLNVPVLIVNGDKDLQVSPEDAKQLKEAKPEAQLFIVTQMNHVLKTITEDTDNLKSYYTPDYPLATSLVTHIAGFIHSINN